MNFKKLINIFLFLIILPALCYGSTYKIRAFKYLTGGIDTSYVDGIDGVDLNVGDLGLVITSTATYFYEVDNSGDAESSPDIISPDTNPGSKRWKLRNTYSITEHETTYNHANYDTAYGWGDHSIAGYALQTITLTAGEGLSGGGDLSANRSFAFDINGLNADGSPDGAADYVATYDADAGTHKKVLLDDLPGGGGGVTDHGALTGLGDDDHTQYALIDGSRDFTGSINLDTIGTDEYKIGGNRALAMPVDNTNIAIGSGAGAALTTGAARNICIGYDAGNNIQTANGNVAIGYNSMSVNTVTGIYNVGLGYKTLRDVTSGSYNLAIGSSTLANVEDGKFNMAFGQLAGNKLTSGSYNACIGAETLEAETTGSYNIAIGYKAMELGVGATYNTALGPSALQDCTGDYNVGIGTNAGRDIISGDGNVAIGTNALRFATTVNYLVAIGYEAGKDVTGAGSTAIGYQAMFENVTGTNNVAIGYQAMLGVAGNSHSSNVAIGYRSLYAVTTGGNNICIGYQAGNVITTGTGNIIIGYDVDPSAAGASNELNIGNVIYGDLSNNNIGVGGATFDGTAANVIQITGSTEPSGSIADTVQFYEKDSSQGAGHGTLGLYLEESVEALGTFTPANKMRVWINGTEYWIQLDPV